MTQWPRRNDEVRVDHIELLAPRDSPTADEASGQIREHRREIRNGQLFAKENRNAQDPNALIVALAGEIASSRRDDRDFMAARELARKRCHNHTTSASERGIFIVAE